MHYRIPRRNKKEKETENIKSQGKRARKKGTDELQKD